MAEERLDLTQGDSEKMRTLDDVVAAVVADWCGCSCLLQR